MQMRIQIETRQEEQRTEREKPERQHRNGDPVSLQVDSYSEIKFSCHWSHWREVIYTPKSDKN